jgi:GNAT superfamily N-acetyltransferase
MRLTVGSADLALDRLDPVCELYDAVFSAPPFFWRADEPYLHRQRLLRLTEDATFGIIIAEVADSLVGFAYGFTLPANTSRWTRLTAPISAEMTAEWPNRTFVLFDYAVEKSARGKGIGRALHHGLLSTRREQRATLTVQPTALDTKRIYEHWGWRKVGEMEGGEGAAAPMFDVYVRDSLADFANP